MIPLDYRKPETTDQQIGPGLFAAGLLVFAVECCFIRIPILTVLSFAAALVVSIFALARRRSRTPLAWIAFGLSIAAGLGIVYVIFFVHLNRA